MAAVLRHTGLLDPFTWVPVRLQTPMEVQIRKDSAAASHSGLD
jgi:hypothetical protein